MIFDIILKCVGALTLLKYLLELMQSLNFSTFTKQPNQLNWAIVTGATDGIGKAMALELGKKGFNILLISRTKSKLEVVQSELKSLLPKVDIQIFALDCQTLVDEKVRAKVAKELEKYDIQVLINNVGMGLEFPMYFHEVSDGRVEGLLDLNMSAATWMIRMVLPVMVKNKSGNIVNVSSGSASLPVPLLSQYAASKKYLECLTMNLAQEYGKDNVKIECHCPMFVATKLSKIRKPSLFTPSPSCYAKQAVNRIGTGTLISPYGPHALQLFVYTSIPKWILAKVSRNMHLSIRKKGMKKLESKSN